MIDFKDLLDFCQAEAIANALRPTEDSVYRGICRSYSKIFHTPLADVLELPPEHVILEVYEDQLDQVDLEKFETLEQMLDTIYGIEDPLYEKKKQDKQDDFDKQAELEEEERVKAGRPVYERPTKKSKPVEQAKSGSINLDYLAKLDGEEG